MSESDPDDPGYRLCRILRCEKPFYDSCQECHKVFCQSHLSVKKHRCPSLMTKFERAVEETRSRARIGKGSRITALVSRMQSSSTPIDDDSSEDETEDTESNESDLDDYEDSLSDSPPEKKSRSMKSTIHDVFELHDGKFHCSLTPVFVKGRTHPKIITSLSNAWRHLSTWHPSLLNRIKANPSQTKILVSQDKTSTSSQLPNYFQVETQPPEKQFEMSQAFLFIVNHFPFSGANEHFHRCMTLYSRGESPQHQIVTAWTIANKYMPRLYSAVDECLRSHLRAASAVGITYDGWTDVSQIKYLIVTCHFITSKWSSKRAILGIHPFTYSMTAEAVKEIVQTMIRNKIGNLIPIACITTDGAGNMFNSAAELAENAWCISHRLHLVVKDAIEQDTRVKSLIDKIHSYVKRVRKSPKRTDMFLQSQPDTQPLKLILDNPLRWSSIYRMLERFEKLLPTIIALRSHPLFRGILIFNVLLFIPFYSFFFIPFFLIFNFLFINCYFYF